MPFRRTRRFHRRPIRRFSRKPRRFARTRRLAHRRNFRKSSSHSARPWKITLGNSNASNPNRSDELAVKSFNRIPFQSNAFLIPTGIVTPVNQAAFALWWSTSIVSSNNWSNSSTGNLSAWNSTCYAYDQQISDYANEYDFQCINGCGFSMELYADTLPGTIPGATGNYGAGRQQMVVSFPLVNGPSSDGFPPTFLATSGATGNTLVTNLAGGGITLDQAMKMRYSKVQWLKPGRSLKVKRYLSTRKVLGVPKSMVRPSCYQTSFDGGMFQPDFEWYWVVLIFPSSNIDRYIPAVQGSLKIVHYTTLFGHVNNTTNAS